MLRIANFTDCDYFVAYNYTGAFSGGATVTVPAGTTWTTPTTSPTGTYYTSAKVFWVGNMFQCILMGFIYPSSTHSSSVPVSPTCTPTGYLCIWNQPTISTNVNLDNY